MEWILFISTLQSSPWTDKPFWSAPVPVISFPSRRECEDMAEIRRFGLDALEGKTLVQCKQKEILTWEQAPLFSPTSLTD